MDIRRPEDLVRAVLDVLKDLVGQEERFLITNQSMYTLITLYEDDLMGAIRDGSADELIDVWKKEVPVFRKEWLGAPEAEDTEFRGFNARIVTESATRSAKSKCDRRKKKR